MDQWPCRHFAVGWLPVGKASLQAPQVDESQAPDLRAFVPFVDALGVPLSLHDVDGKFVHMNAAAEQVSGVSNAAAQAYDIASLVAPEDREHVLAHFRRAVASGEPVDFGTAFVDVGGRERYTWAQHLPLLHEGRTIGVLVLAWEANAPGSVTGAHWLPNNLSPRHAEVLRLIASGRATAEVAEELGLASSTVRNHIRDVLAQLGAHSRQEAIAKAQRAGLMPLRPLGPLASDS